MADIGGRPVDVPRRLATSWRCTSAIRTSRSSSARGPRTGRFFPSTVDKGTTPGRSAGSAGYSHRAKSWTSTTASRPGGRVSKLYTRVELARVLATLDRCA